MKNFVKEWMNEEGCGREGCGVVLRRVEIFRLLGWVKRKIKIEK